MRLLLGICGCAGVFFGGQQGEERFPGGNDSATVSDSGETDDTGHDTDSDDAFDEVIEGIYQGTFVVDADVWCVGTVTLEVSGRQLSGSAECGNKDYDIEGSLGEATISREDGSTWELSMSAGEDQELWGAFEGEDSSGVATEGEFEAFLDGD